MSIPFGSITLLGSGETSLAGGRAFETIAKKIPRPVHVALLETPAGFELNSAQVAMRVGEFLKMRLQNFNPVVEAVPARKRGTDFSPDDPNIVDALLQANIIFMGAGSPTYAVRQLQGSLAWDLVRARHRLGAALVFASAATIAVGECVLPVYEIYKVGDDVRTVPGLKLFADFGLSLSFIPHWNNTDGSPDVDTSRCFVGLDRFGQWCELLPHGHTIVGLDEHTSLIIDFATGKCYVNGIGSVTLLRESKQETFPSGTVFPVKKLGKACYPKTPDEGISSTAWDMVNDLERNMGPDKVPAEVVKMMEERQRARISKDWAAADILRQKIAAVGWMVQDTPEGQKVVRQL